MGAYGRTSGLSRNELGARRGLRPDPKIARPPPADGSLGGAGPLARQRSSPMPCAHHMMNSGDRYVLSKCCSVPQSQTHLSVSESFNHVDSPQAEQHVSVIAMLPHGSPRSGQAAGRPLGPLTTRCPATTMPAPTRSDHTGPGHSAAAVAPHQPETGLRVALRGSAPRRRGNGAPPQLRPVRRPLSATSPLPPRSRPPCEHNGVPADGGRPAT
jgi:hypothetical protein